MSDKNEAAKPEGTFLGGAVAAAMGLAFMALIVLGAWRFTGSAPPAPKPQPPAHHGPDAPEGPGPATPGPKPAVALSEVVPAAKATEASPLLGAHAEWPVPGTLAPLEAREGRAPEVTVKADELTFDVRSWFAADLIPQDLEKALGRDAQGQIYVKLGRPGVTGLASRNRVAGLYTVGFTFEFDAPGALEPGAILERLKGVFSPTLAAEVSKRSLRASPMVPATAEDFAGILRFDPEGLGQTFPYLYVYAKPRRVVGVLQTIGIVRVK